MPKDGDPLPAAQIALIRAWIDQGAVSPQTGAAATATAETEHQAPQHSAYRRPVRPPLPASLTSFFHSVWSSFLPSFVPSSVLN